jgi:hypothetical protein
VKTIVRRCATVVLAAVAAAVAILSFGPPADAAVVYGSSSGEAWIKLSADDLATVENPFADMSGICPPVVQSYNQFRADQQLAGELTVTACDQLVTHCVESVDGPNVAIVIARDLRTARCDHYEVY